MTLRGSVLGGLLVMSCTQPRMSSVNARAESPAGVSLVDACTPTGPELCFNATDDNCNGVIDEGCGLAAGVVQFMVAWGDCPADVDLVVTVPSRERVSDGHRHTPSGFHLDRDCPGDGCAGQNVESVYFGGFEPPVGFYTVEVRLAESRGAPMPVRTRFGARIGGRTYSAEVVLNEPDSSRVFTFVVARP